MSPNDLAILTDFDGTVSVADLADMVLQKYVHEGWEDYQFRYGSGMLEHKDEMAALEDLFRLVDRNEQEIWSDLSGRAEMRPNFDALVDYSYGYFPIIITSLGLDFIIKRILSENKWAGKVSTHIPATRMIGNGIEFHYPELEFADSVNLKDDMVSHFRKKGKKVIYIGNGNSDFPAARKADIVFAVKGDSLADLCRYSNVGFHEFSDFSEVLEVIEKL